ncbi:MAG: sulfatase-like hydrolase/transferase [bacterium]
MSLSDIVLPVLLVSCFALLLWLPLAAIVKDRNKAGLILTTFFALFYASGHLLNKASGLIGAPTNKWLVVIITFLCLVVFALAAYKTIKIRTSLYNLTKFLNLFAAFALLIPLTSATAGLFRQDYKNITWQPARIASSRLERYPDIYYIILDGYARGDILEELYHYENNQFLDHLVQKGFYVANKSSANYCQTVLSIASSLNFEYLDDLVKQYGAEFKSRKPVKRMIKNNRVINCLKQYGYKFVTFSSGYSLTEVRNPDKYIRPLWAFDEFQNVLLNITPLPVLSGLFSVSTGGFQYQSHRHHLLYKFEHLADPTNMDAPVFVFAHFMAPHPPFVFDEQGKPSTPGRSFSYSDGSHFMAKAKGNRDEYIQNYRKQLIFINKKVLAAVDDIISNSSQPPIIILQSDHGAGSRYDQENVNNTYLKERMSILNAYYLPDNGRKQLYDEITPVNTFRVILNHYFGTNYELLKDKSYYSSRSKPYKFIDVTGELKIDREPHNN